MPQNHYNKVKIRSINNIVSINFGFRLSVSIPAQKNGRGIYTPIRAMLSCSISSKQSEQLLLCNFHNLFYIYQNKKKCFTDNYTTKFSTNRNQVLQIFMRKPNQVKRVSSNTKQTYNVFRNKIKSNHQAKIGNNYHQHRLLFGSKKPC